jgi:hypothetical protein
MEKDISLEKRSLEDIDPEDIKLLRSHCINGVDGSTTLGDPQTEDTIAKMLAYSEPFLSFLRYVEEQPGAHPQNAKVIDVGADFQREFASKGKKTGMSWTGYLLYKHPDIFQKCLGRDFARSAYINEGWHSVLTPAKPEDGFAMIAAKLSSFGRLDYNIQKKMLRTLFPDRGEYRNIRYSSEEMESCTGLRVGRVHFFLADDALSNFSAIGIHKTYTEENIRPNALVGMTMHARFLFVCSAKDLQDWFKTNEARFAFSDKMRVEGYLHPVTQTDIERISADQRTAIEEAINGKTARYRAGQITADRDMADMYLRAIQTTLGNTRLDWKNSLVAQAFDIAKRVEALNL